VQNVAAHKVTGARRRDRITPILEVLHWLPVRYQRVVFKTALMVWKGIHGVAPAYLSDLCIPAMARPGRQDLRSTGFPRPDCSGASKFRRQWSDYLEQSAACTTSTRAVTERIHTCTEDAPVLIRPAMVRRFTRLQHRIQMHQLTD